MCTERQTLNHPGRTVMFHLPKHCHAAVDVTGANANKIEIIEARRLYSSPYRLGNGNLRSKIGQRLYTVTLDLNRVDVVCHAESVVGSTAVVTRSPVLEGHSHHKPNLRCTYPNPPGSWQRYGHCRDHDVSIIPARDTRQCCGWKWEKDTAS